MIKQYEKGKLVSIQLTEWEQYDLALKNNRSLRAQKFKEKAPSSAATGDSEEVWSACLKEGLQEET